MDDVLAESGIEPAFEDDDAAPAEELVIDPAVLAVVRDEPASVIAQGFWGGHAAFLGLQPGTHGGFPVRGAVVSDLGGDGGESVESYGLKVGEAEAGLGGKVHGGEWEEEGWIFEASGRASRSEWTGRNLRVRVHGRSGSAGRRCGCGLGRGRRIGSWDEDEDLY